MRNPTVSEISFRVTIGNGLSLLAGVGTQILLASIFGTGSEMDAYFTAVALPLYLEAVLLAGLSFVLIPAFISLRVNNEEQAWALIITFFLIATMILTTISLLISFFAANIIANLAPGLTPLKAQLSAKMLSILAFTVPTVGLMSLSVGVQNARGYFFGPAVIPALGSLANIIFVVTSYHTMGPIVLAWGALLSSILQAIFIALPVASHFSVKALPLKHPRVKELLKLISPFVIFGLLNRAVPVVERYFASALPDGDLSYLGYASKISSIIISVFGAGIATAIFPSMTRSYLTMGRGGLGQAVSEGFRITLAVAIPAFIVLSIGSLQFVQVLFERGSFTYNSSSSIAPLIPIVLLVALMLMLGNIIGRAYYVQQLTTAIPLIGAISTFIYIFTAHFLARSLGYVGLAWAQVVQAGFTTGVAYYILLRRLHVNLFVDLKYFLALGIASGAPAWFCSYLMSGCTPFISFPAIIASGGFSYILLLKILKDDATLQLIGEISGWSFLRSYYSKIVIKL